MAYQPPMPAGRIAARLLALGITLPPAPAPLANYVPWTRSGAVLIISGQLPLVEGRIGWTGKLGGTMSMEQAQLAARQCVLNVLAQAQAALGDLDRLERVLRLGGFISSTPDFIRQAEVMNGASDVMVEILGDAGRHARTTIGVPALPGDASVEVEAMFAVAG